MKLLIINGAMYSGAFGKGMFSETSTRHHSSVKEDDVKSAHLVCFTGGADVDPEFYGEEHHPKTNTVPHRDAEEARIFDWCLKHKKPMVGICRGAQLLTVLSGGKLIQHVGGHAVKNFHFTTAIDRQKLRSGLENDAIFKMEVNSTHHQMMYPWNMNDNMYDIICYSKDVATKYEGTPMEEIHNERLVKNPSINRPYVIEPEVVYYPATRSLAVQYHPERMSTKDKGYSFFNKLVGDYLIGPSLQR